MRAHVEPPVAVRWTTARAVSGTLAVIGSVVALLAGILAEAISEELWVGQSVGGAGIVAAFGAVGIVGAWLATMRRTVAFGIVFLAIAALGAPLTPLAAGAPMDSVLLLAFAGMPLAAAAALVYGQTY